MSEIISRKEARERGLKRYFTGKPCVRGHIAKRWAVSANCVDCLLSLRTAYQERERRYSAANPEYNSWRSNEGALRKPQTQ